MNPSRYRFSWLLLGTSLLLGACSNDGGSPPSEPETSVRITTTPAVRQSFHATVHAWGSVIGDPQRARSLSLGHGGQILSLHVAAGQSVRAGQPLLTIAPEPATRSAHAQAESALALARGELVRTRSLFEQHLATESQLATAGKALRDAQAGLAAQQAVGGGSASEVLRAPADGVVGTLAVANGDRFAANAPLLGFTPAQALAVALSVAPSAAALGLQAGQTVQLQPALGGDAPLQGRIRTAGRGIDPQTHLVPVLVEVPADARLQLGDAVDARIELAPFDAWAVPRAAVLQDDKGAYLFVVRDGKARRIPVTVRQPEGDTLGVDAALPARAAVIVDGAYEAEDGMPVREGQR